MEDTSPSRQPLAPEMLLDLCPYTRFPERLKQLDPGLADFEKDDEFGVHERLRAIEAVFAGVQLGRVIDLGGNSGYFALSLLDSRRASHATVVDLDAGALAAGRMMAAAMNVDERIDFVEREIDLEYVRALADYDTVICLNLIHHAGALYDVAEVKGGGWEPYAEEWLHTLRRKAQRAIIGVGFKGRKPVNWDVPKSARLVRFRQMLERAGWAIRYDANVAAIRANGVEAAGKRTRETGWTARNDWRAPLDRAASLWRRVAGGRAAKLTKYHLFLLE